MEKSDYAKEQLAKLDAVLDEYESSLGLPAFSDNFHDDTAKNICRCLEIKLKN